MEWIFNTDLSGIAAGASDLIIALEQPELSSFFSSEILCEFHARSENGDRPLSPEVTQMAEPKGPNKEEMYVVLNTDTSSLGLAFLSILRSCGSGSRWLHDHGSSADSSLQVEAPTGLNLLTRPSAACWGQSLFTVQTCSEARLAQQPQWHPGHLVSLLHLEGVRPKLMGDLWPFWVPPQVGSFSLSSFKTTQAHYTILLALLIDSRTCWLVLLSVHCTRETQLGSAKECFCWLGMT